MTAPNNTTRPQPTGKCHPVCLLLPEIGEAEFRELVEDIRNNGQLHPITVDENGDILDGRHRYRAMMEQLFETPRFRVFDGPEEAKVALIISENVHRRHLTVLQRAAVAAELTEKLTEAAQARQKTGKPAAPEAKGTAAEQAAKMVGGVSARSVERAQKRMREDPAAHAQAKAGTLPRAKPTAGASKAVRDASVFKPTAADHPEQSDRWHDGDLFELSRLGSRMPREWAVRSGHAAIKRQPTLAITVSSRGGGSRTGLLITLAEARRLAAALTMVADQIEPRTLVVDMGSTVRHQSD
jgi:ParB-like chromosome segregation protein Spo0J